MDTIKSYLETMFANLPATAEVLKAKDELWGMMEDKYNELISEGKSENEAVGTVISEMHVGCRHLQSFWLHPVLKCVCYQQEQKTVC